MPTNKQLADLVINKVESQEVYDYMVANDLINDDELYLVGGEGSGVLYTPQELTEEQKTQALANIGAASNVEFATMSTQIDDIKSNIIPVYTTFFDANSNEGKYYSINAPEITALTEGLTISVILHTTTTSTQPYLTIRPSNLVAQIAIGVGVSYTPTSTWVPTRNDWIQAGYRITLRYSGTVWMVEEYKLITAADLQASVPIAKGGTGAETAEAARTNLGAASQVYVDSSLATIETQIDEVIAAISSIRVSSHALILTDEVNGYDYAITMRDGNLVSSLIANQVTLASQPSVTAYVAGESFDPTGMEIIATYPDGSTRTIEEFTYSSDIITLSTNSVQVSCMVSGQVYNISVNITVTELDSSLLQDFEYTVEDGVYTLTAWKGTTDGVASTTMVVPDLPVLIAFEG